jgi:hypothetical protein
LPFIQASDLILMKEALMAAIVTNRPIRGWQPKTDRPALFGDPEELFFRGAVIALPFGLLLWSCLLWAIHAAS